jgi:hypothetical protein
MRLKACIEVGLKEVYIVQAADLTEEQKNQFIVKDNVGFGEWDWDVLANEWEAVKLEEWGLDVWQLNMDNDFEDAEDIITNNEKYDHVDDIAVNYLNSDVKKFEIYINHEDYDTVVTKINSIKKNNNIENNSDAIVWLILNS